MKRELLKSFKQLVEKKLKPTARMDVRERGKNATSNIIWSLEGNHGRVSHALKFSVKGINQVPFS